MAKKRSVNPFRLWGAWVGLIIAIIILYVMSGNIIVAELFSFSPALLNWMILPIGFSIGYGLHLLIQKVFR